MAAVCVTLFILSMERQSQQTGTLTAGWIEKWNLHGRSPNPPDMRVPRKLEYLHRYNIEAAYIPTRGTLESNKSYRRWLYKCLLISINAAVGQPKMKIQKLWPGTDWEQVWKNLEAAPIKEHVRSDWYQAIHDLIPTNVRLHRINVTSTDKCQRCVEADTLEHRLINCGEGKLIWNYTKTAIATMLRTIPARIPNDWLLRPHFKIWPDKRKHAVLWTLAQLVSYSFQHRTSLTLQEYMDFLFRSRWKLLTNRRGRDSVGNYLAIVKPTYQWSTTRNKELILIMMTTVRMWPVREIQRRLIND